MRLKENLSNSEIIKKIMEKKEFSEIPIQDVNFVFELINKPQMSSEEKVKFSRNLLKRNYSAFTSDKILTSKKRPPEWILKKHFSTRERVKYYSKIYSRILNSFSGEVTIFDLGCGVNGFSYPFLLNPKLQINYIGVEAVGQLVTLQNKWFKKEKISGRVIHDSLFNFENIESLISKINGKKIIFLFKIIDSLEALKRNYSKKLLFSLIPKVDLTIVSFVTLSLIKKEKFKANRNWLINFIKENFKVLDDFEICGERYICFSKR